MIRVGDYLLPYEPAPYLEKYQPIFEHLAQEVDRLREVWHHLAPVWHPRLEELLREEGLGLQLGVAVKDDYGIIMNRVRNRFLVNGREYDPDCALKLLTHEVRYPDDLGRVAARLRDVVQCFWRAVTRMKEEALAAARQTTDHRSLMV